MSHPIYYSSITNEVRQLEQLAIASKYAISIMRSLYPINEINTEITLEIQIRDYFNWLIDTVSSSLINISTRTRVLQDSYDFSIPDNPDYSADDEAFKRFDDILHVIKGNIKVSIRECCNKIIHATSYELEFQADVFGTNYWTGYCLLTGKHNKKEWSVKLNIINFSHALRYYISTIEYL